MAHSNVMTGALCSDCFWGILQAFILTDVGRGGELGAKSRRRTRCRFTQDSGMPDGVSNAGISRSARSTAFVSNPSRYPAGWRQGMHAVHAVVAYLHETSSVPIRVVGSHTGYPAAATLRNRRQAD